MSPPKIVAVPSVGFKTVMSMLMVVVFPAPLGPRKPKISPWLTLKFMWSTAVRVLLKTLVNPSTFMSSTLLIFLFT